MDQTWPDREQRLLEAIVARFDAGHDIVHRHQLQADTGLTEQATRAGLRALWDAKLIRGMKGGGGPVMQVHAVTGEARHIVGAWPPADPGAAFLVVLDRAIATTDDPDRQTRLRRLRDASVDVGTKVLGEVLGKLAAGSIGLTT